MAHKNIILIGDPRLKKVNKVVTDFTSSPFKNLIQDLKDTMKHEDLIGLAAPQIAKNVQVFVTHPRNTKARNIGKADVFRVYVNPKITFTSKNDVIIYEGCGCVPNIFGPVDRPVEIKIEAQDEKGQLFSLYCDGILSRVVQHEYDHMSGIEFIEKIADYKKIVSREYYIKTIKNSKEQLKASQITKIILSKK